ncbi:SECRETED GLYCOPROTEIN EP1 putative-RELATED [Salix purpurea]|uniref:SECRETED GLYCOPROTEIN EP1 putative-RELATED n=1 Tax=Salix purpurea TaxID=77065 RepID=A0A9Q1AGH8_SALPP|nr:SECRETED GLYCOPROTEIN EP1 putative-RELATED [Salix purpurea]
MELSLFSLCFLFSIPFIAHATVPPSSTFKHVNEGEFGFYSSEYAPDYRPLPIGTSPFQLMFYNTTPNAYTLALLMGTRRSESARRWVWEANRGNPVRENATLTFGEDGNLVLVDAGGRIAWQTNTANKGVVGFEVLPNGNMVLHDSKGKFIWQSFDSPTDTILVGQSLRVGGVTRLVSRASQNENSDGPYSLVMESKRLVMYYKSPNSPKQYLYYTFAPSQDRLQNATLKYSPDSYDDSASDVTFDLSSGGGSVLARPKFNATLSFLRIGIDGNLRIYSYNNKVDYMAWDVAFTLFSRDDFPESECQLPERCGKFGLCEDSQCVACPLPGGLLGWSKSCEPVKPPACGSTNFYYYKLEGVDHSMSKYAGGSGPVKEEDCGRKCSSDCKCMGYFYNKETSKCSIAYDLQTLTKVSNSTHVGYIKAPKK